MSVKLVGIFSPLSGLSSEELGNLAMGVIELVEAADRITGSQGRQTVMHAPPGIRCRGLDFLLGNQGHLFSFTSFPARSD